MHQATAAEVKALLQIGFDTATKPREPVAEKVERPVEETAEEKIERLERALEEFKTETKTEKMNAASTSELERAIASNTFLQEHPEMIEGVRYEALARQAVNKRYSLTDTVKQATVDREKVLMGQKTKHDAEMEATLKVRNAMGGSSRSSGATSKIDPEKKYTMKDVSSGESRRILEGILRDHEGED